VVDEPVRGGLPHPAFFSLPGVEQLRAYQRGLTPAAPLSRLTGFRLTAADVGSVTLSLPLSAWLQLGDGMVDLKILCEVALRSAASTTAAAGHEVQTVAVSIHHLRPCTLKSEILIARARVLNSGPTFRLAAVVIEDALGRAVAQASGSVLVRAMDPPPPPLPAARRRIQDAVYATPDPPVRPLPADTVLPVDHLDETTGWGIVLPRWAAGEMTAPFCELLDICLVHASEGATAWVLRSSEWHCLDRREVQPGVVLSLAHYALTSAAGTLCPPEQRVGVIEQTVSFVAPVVADGRELLARATIVHQRQFLFATVEVTDGDGHQVAFGSQTAVLTHPARSARDGAKERVLATVLFTDIVGSTQRAVQLGDAAWRELLEEHDAWVRRQLHSFKGHEVKRTGDGFLATFDSPARAVLCARAIRDAVKRIGIEVRAGLHTGECELVGADVAGIAVHIASRIQSTAGPSEVLVSSTVRDLVAGSGLRFTDHGRHILKGIAGDWQLFVVEG
jgi:class 3 adenylate cyclase/acyl-coenzyme A thioesterase PaaI-like protein